MSAKPFKFSWKVDKQKAKWGLQHLVTQLPVLTHKEQVAAMEEAKKEARGPWYGGNRYAVPRRPKQKYVRTGTYGRSFEVTSNGRYVVLKSDATQKGRRYTQYVGGDNQGKGQAGPHVGRWPVIFEVVKKSVDKAIRSLSTSIRNLAVAAGFEGRPPQL